MWLFLLACSNPPEEETPVAGVPCVSADVQVHVGDVEPGLVAASTARVRNACEGTLTVTGVSLQSEAADGPFDFSLPGAIALDEGESSEIRVTFEPPAAGFFEDRLRIDTNDAENPRWLVDLAGRGLGPGVAARPTTYDVGTQWIGCSQRRDLVLENEGSEDIVFTDARIEGSAAFTLDDEPPYDLLVGDEIAVGFHYTPTDALGDEAELVFEAAALEVRVPLFGKGALYAPATETLEQWITDQVDFLLVIDNTSAGEFAQLKVVDALPAFADALDPVDFQIGVITADNPRFRGDVTVPAPDADVEDHLGVLVLAGTSGPADDAILTAKEATQPDGDASVEGFLRPDAAFAILFVTTRTDDASDDEIADALAWWTSLKPDRRGFRAHAIAGDVPTSACPAEALPGHGYDAVAAATHGVFASVCDPTFDAALARVVAQSVPDGRTFPLEGSPLVQTLAVRVDGTAATAWTWDAALNAVVFDATAIPAASATVTFDYALPPDCDTVP